MSAAVVTEVVDADDAGPDLEGRLYPCPICGGAGCGRCGGAGELLDTAAGSAVRS